MELEGNEAEMKEMMKEIAFSNFANKEIVNMCERSKFGLVTRDYHANRLEEEYYTENIQNTKDSTAGTRLKIEQQQKLCKELNLLNTDELRKLKYNQHYWQTSPDLRDVETSLRASYVAKKVTAQYLEQKYLKQKDQDDLKAANEALKRGMFASLEKDKLEKAEEIRRKAQYKQDLHDQMIQNYKNQQLEYEEKLIERREMDAIVKRINEEDVRIMQEKKIQMLLAQEEIAKFKEAQQKFKDKRKKETYEETRKLVETNKEKERKDREKEKIKNDANEKREKIKMEIGQKNYIEYKKKLEKSEAISDYIIDDVLLKEEEEQRQKELKKIRTRIEEQNMLEKQLEEKRQREEQEKLEDYRWGQVSKLEDKKYWDSVNEKATKKRNYLVALKNETLETIKDRIVNRVEDLHNNNYLMEQLELARQEKMNILKEQRLQKIKEHLPNVVGYLRPGFLQPEDLPKLGADFVRKYVTK